jgi:uncharacterized protein (TIGR00288 family)
MSSIKNENLNIALFFDFENIALGVRTSPYQDINIKLILDKLLLKGSIVVKKAYCDWERYKDYKKIMHEFAFELIEIPHTRQSGKNSADIRMVVDALDLCYTKNHINTFVIISGDSDFSPLVSKLKENDKHVIGIGIKDGTSSLLSGNCDEFIFYEDIARAAMPAKKITDKKAEDKIVSKKQDALNFIVETIKALSEERDEDEFWGSMVKLTMRRTRPGFTESAYGYSSFRELVEDAHKKNLLIMRRQDNSGQYTIRLHDNL